MELPKNVIEEVVSCMNEFRSIPTLIMNPGLGDKNSPNLKHTENYFIQNKRRLSPYIYDKKPSTMAESGVPLICVMLLR